MQVGVGKKAVAMKSSRSSCASIGLEKQGRKKPTKQAALVHGFNQGKKHPCCAEPFVGGFLTFSCRQLPVFHLWSPFGDLEAMNDKNGSMTCCKLISFQGTAQELAPDIAHRSFRAVLLRYAAVGFKFTSRVAPLAISAKGPAAKWFIRLMETSRTCTISALVL
jgi:hypothetical protein